MVCIFLRWKRSAKRTSFGWRTRSSQSCIQLLPARIRLHRFFHQIKGRDCWSRRTSLCSAVTAGTRHARMRWRSSSPDLQRTPRRPKRSGRSKNVSGRNAHRSYFRINRSPLRCPTSSSGRSCPSRIALSAVFYRALFHLTVYSVVTNSREYDFEVLLKRDEEKKTVRASCSPQVPPAGPRGPHIRLLARPAEMAGGCADYWLIDRAGHHRHRLSSAGQALAGSAELLPGPSLGDCPR